MGLPRPPWSDVGEVNKASGPDEEKENEKDATDKDLDTPQPTVKTKRKMNNGNWAHRLRPKPQRCPFEDDWVSVGGGDVMNKLSGVDSLCC